MVFLAAETPCQWMQWQQIVTHQTKGESQLFQLWSDLCVRGASNHSERGLLKSRTWNPPSRWGTNRGVWGHWTTAGPMADWHRPLVSAIPSRWAERHVETTREFAYQHLETSRQYQWEYHPLEKWDSRGSSIVEFRLWTRLHVGLLVAEDYPLSMQHTSWYSNMFIGITYIDSARIETYGLDMTDRWVGKHTWSSVPCSRPSGCRTSLW